MLGRLLLSFCPPSSPGLFKEELLSCTPAIYLVYNTMAWINTDPASSGLSEKPIFIQLIKAEWDFVVL